MEVYVTQIILTFFAGFWLGRWAGLRGKNNERKKIEKRAIKIIEWVIYGMLALAAAILLYGTIMKIVE